MPDNPFTASCAVPACGQPVAVRGRCAAHAAQGDAHRALGSDRHHVAHYASVRWRRLRKQILAAHPWCQCDDCRGAVYWPPATVVHHVKPHSGDEDKFFDEANLQALSKPCHDRITGRSHTHGGPRS